MSIFEYTTVAISIVLGLGLAQLLSGALDLVRYRHRTRFHWAPLLWVAIIFWIQVELMILRSKTSRTTTALTLLFLTLQIGVLAIWIVPSFG